MAVITIIIKDKFLEGEIEISATAVPKPKEGEGSTVAQLIGNTIVGMVKDGTIMQFIPGWEKEE